MVSPAAWDKGADSSRQQPTSTPHLMTILSRFSGHLTVQPPVYIGCAQDRLE